MISVDRFVDVQISRGTIQVSRRGFGVPLILSSSTVLGTDRAQVFGSLQEIEDAGFATTSAEYETAVLLFSQQFQPDEVVIGRIDAGDADIAASISAVQDANDDWYALILLDRTVSEVQGAAAYIETQKKIFISATADSDVIDGTGDIIETLQALNYSRTAMLYSGVAGTQQSEAAWAGRQLPLDPGSTTWANKQLVGIPADQLTTAQFNTAQGKNGNVYVPVLGVNVTTDGVMVNGEYLDIVRFTDFLQARIEENVFQVIAENEKIPYTASGIAQIEQPLRQALLEGVRVNGLASPDGIQPAFTITVPDINTVSAADKAARILRNVNFTAFLAGAIHRTQIRGTLSL